MATIVNNPSSDVADTSGTGVVVGIIIALLLLVLFFVFGLPYLRESQAPIDTGGSTLDVDVSVPGSGTGGTGGTGDTGGTITP